MGRQRGSPRPSRRSLYRESHCGFPSLPAGRRSDSRLARIRLVSGLRCMTFPSAIYDLPKRALGPHAKRLIFTPKTLEVLYSERQLKPYQSESGGQLFGEFANDVVTVTTASTPSPKDQRSRYRFTRSRATEQAEIDHEFSNGLHYIGDWHTHPEPRPAPSSTDHSGARRLFRTSRHELPNFLLVIVGTSDDPADLYVALVNGRRLKQLS